MTVEHRPVWAAAVNATAHRAFGGAELAGRWTLKVLPPEPGQVLTFAEAESYDRFKRYANVAFLESAGSRPRFDFVAIDGQARLACLQRALWMLRPHGGVLLLNNAQRGAYREVWDLIPARWLRLVDTNTFGQTVVWVSCEEGRCT